MPILFKVIQRRIPRDSSGKKQFYASANSTGETNLENLTTEIEKISTVSGADIRAVLYSLVDMIPHHLSEGKIVRLGDLGSFRISLSSEGKTKEEEVTAAAIKKGKILFTPGSRFKNMLKTLKFKKK